MFVSVLLLKFSIEIIFILKSPHFICIVLSFFNSEECCLTLFLYIYIYMYIKPIYVCM